MLIARYIADLNEYQVKVWINYHRYASCHFYVSLPDPRVHFDFCSCQMNGCDQIVSTPTFKVRCFFIVQEPILLKYLKDHKAEDAVKALRSLKINKKTMCSMLIMKTLGKSGILCMHVLKITGYSDMNILSDDRG